MVVHFDPPSDPKAYLHRSGRTARAGESGAVVTIATPRQLDTVVAMQRDAGVTARHHDIRTTPRPMAALVLAESGTTEAPSRPSRGGRPQGRGQGRPQGGRPYRSGHGHTPRRNGYAGAKAGSTKTFGKPTRSGGPAGATRPSGKKARWTAADKAARNTRS
jgi:superfamily II DNA/RNA helicase